MFKKSRVAAWLGSVVLLVGVLTGCSTNFGGNNAGDIYDVTPSYTPADQGHNLDHPDGNTDPKARGTVE